jgi:hypothetical protein
MWRHYISGAPSQLLAPERVGRADEVPIITVFEVVLWCDRGIPAAL